MVVDRFEIDRRRELEKDGDDALERRELAVRDCDAVAEPRRAQRFAIAQRLKYRRGFETGRGCCPLCKRLQNIVLAGGVCLNDNTVLREDIGQFHNGPKLAFRLLSASA